MKKGIKMDAKDNVGVAIQDINQGNTVSLDDGSSVVAITPVGQAHKIALKDIKKGEYIIKYGEVMGYATQDIAIGQHVHLHNCDSEKLMK